MRLASLLLLGVQGTALINVITKQGRVLFTSNPAYTNDVRGTMEQYAVIRGGRGRGRSGRSTGTESGRGGYGRQNARTELGSRKEDLLPTSTSNSSSSSRVKRSSPATSSDEDITEEDVDQSMNSDMSQFGKINEEERLQKVIARAGIASRREAEKMILDGRVVVNGKLIVELGEKVKPRKDIILVDGKKVVLPDAKNTFWVLVNKPRSVLTTMEDDKDRETLLDIVPKAKELRLLPVGRLDRVTTGLMILTNDNGDQLTLPIHLISSLDKMILYPPLPLNPHTPLLSPPLLPRNPSPWHQGWIHPLTHPSFRHVKRYEVVVQGYPSEEAIEQMNQGTLTLPGDSAPLLPCKTVIIDTDRPSGLTLIDITLEESRPQQIQQMMDHLECPVVSMKRTEFGPMKLGSLRKGQWREMTANEVGKLKDSCEPARSTATSSYPARQQQRGLRGEGDRFRLGGGRGGVAGRGRGRGVGRGGEGGRQSRVFGLGRGGRGGGRESGRGGRSFTPRPPGSGYATKAARGLGQGQGLGTGLTSGRGRGRGQGSAPGQGLRPSVPGRAGRGAGRQGRASDRSDQGDNDSDEYSDNDDFRR